MPELAPRYRLENWPTGPQAEYDVPNEALGWFLSAWNNSLRLERMLADLSRTPDAYVADNATRADRAGETIRVSGAWGDDELELPFASFSCEAAAFLEWMRSQPPTASDDLWVVLAYWRAGTISAGEAVWRLRTLFGPDAWSRTMSRADAEARLRDCVAQLRPMGEPLTDAKLCVAIVSMVAGFDVEPRCGAEAIAALAPQLEEQAELVQPFVILSANAQTAAGDPERTAAVEHEILAAAAALLSAAG